MRSLPASVEFTPSLEIYSTSASRVDARNLFRGHLGIHTQTSPLSSLLPERRR